MDNSPGDMDFHGSLWRRANDVDVTSEDMVQVSTTTSGSDVAIQYVDDFSIGVCPSSTMKITPMWHSVGMHPTLSTSSLRFYGCRIKYTLNPMLP
jgi:hypothetical protein